MAEWKSPTARVAVTAQVNVQAPGSALLDPAATLAVGDTLLALGQTDSTENGLWIYGGTTQALMRSTVPIGAGGGVFITSGTWANQVWLLNSNGLNWSSQPVNNRYRFGPPQLAKWSRALARVRNGTADAKILCVGDSTTSGVGGTTAATIPPLKAWPAQLASLFNQGALAATHGLGVPPSQVDSTAVDQRWTVGAGWSKSALGGASASYTGNNPGGSLVFTDDRINADVFDVYYLTGSGYGTITATATGGTPIVQSSAGADGLTKLTAVAAGAATTNTMTITATGQIFIVAVEPRLTSGTRVRVSNAGVSSVQTSHWTANSTTTGGIPLIQAYAPDLTIISLGIVDAGKIPAATAATIATDLKTIGAAAAISGDVIIMTPPVPNTATTNSANLANYVPSMNLPAFAVADLYKRCGSYSLWNALGMMNDSLHPNNLGYQDIAQFLYGGLIQV